MGVDTRNVRNIVLMRPVNSMIEIKQIIGRGTQEDEDKKQEIQHMTQSTFWSQDKAAKDFFCQTKAPHSRFIYPN